MKDFNTYASRAADPMHASFSTKYVLLYIQHGNCDDKDLNSLTNAAPAWTFMASLILETLKSGQSHANSGRTAPDCEPSAREQPLQLQRLLRQNMLALFRVLLTTPGLSPRSTATRT